MLAQVSEIVDRMLFFFYVFFCVIISFHNFSPTFFISEDYKLVEFSPNDPPPIFIDGQPLSSTSIKISWRADAVDTSAKHIPGQYTVEYVVVNIFVWLKISIL